MFNNVLEYKYKKIYIITIFVIITFYINYELNACVHFIDVTLFMLMLDTPLWFRNHHSLVMSFWSHL